MPTPSFLKPEILNQAVSVAMASPSKKKVGSILLKKNKVIATAVNLDFKTHPIQYAYGCKVGKPEKAYIHSEIGVLIRARDTADTIVVARVGGHSKIELRCARPCSVCSAFLKYESKVVHIHYSTDEGFMYEYWGDT